MSCRLSRVVVAGLAAYLVADLGHNWVVTWAAVVVAMAAVVLWSRTARSQGATMCRLRGTCANWNVGLLHRTAPAGDAGAPNGPEPAVLVGKALVLPPTATDPASIGINQQRRHDDPTD